MVITLEASADLIDFPQPTTGSLELEADESIKYQVSSFQHPAALAPTLRWGTSSSSPRQVIARARR